MKSNQPIGIFDSGIGGLTVARAVKNILPHESLIYFGDIAHLPYGDKSTAAIQAYSIKITDFLLQNNCKVILIACNSASSAAYELVHEYVGKKARVFDVIQPTIDFIRENYEKTKIGLIGTKQTIKRAVYKEKINALSQQINLSSLETPLLVPMIEEGFVQNKISMEIIAQYLGNEIFSDIQSLILGCTHYPIIKDEIAGYYKGNNQNVEIIDSAETVARALKSYLEFNQLINKGTESSDKFYVSDYTDSFEAQSRIFFGKEVHLEKYPIWD